MSRLIYVSPHKGEGRAYVDLERGIFYRLAEGQRETKKRQPPVPILPRLLAHLRRWVAQVHAAEDECYCPVESLGVADARHAPHHEQPEPTLQGIASFVNHVLWSHREAAPAQASAR
jgi:hypothetical protein